jgi:hypothetical protein
VAEAGGQTNPGASHDGEDLREDQVAEGELARELVNVDGVVGCDWRKAAAAFGHAGIWRVLEWGHWLDSLTPKGDEGR